MLITIEGIEGVGKTTQIKLLEKYLGQKGVPFISTREPGGSPVCENIRNILLHTEMSPITELMLYQASRAEHFENVIEPALKNDRVVICDRFADASIAYQGYGRGIDIELIDTLNKISTKGTKPDVTFILDIDISEAFKRLSYRGSEPDRFEKLNEQFYERVRRAYLDIAKKDPKRLCVIDAAPATDKIHNKITEELEKRLKNDRKSHKQNKDI